MQHFRSNPPSRAIKPRPAMTPAMRALRALENHMDETGVAPSTLSRQIMNDSRLVRELRAGRELGDLATRRIAAFLSGEGRDA